MKRTIALLFALLSTGCSSRGSAVMAPLDTSVDGRSAIIVIPGFYGSALRAKDSGDRVFLTAWESLFGRDALSLYQEELGTPHGPELEVEGFLAAVPVIPGLYDVNVYGPLVRELRREFPQSQVIPFAYDWRDDITLAVAKLDHLVQLLQEKHANSVSIVSHSMGGLVLAYYLAFGGAPPATAEITWSGAKAVKRAVFMGTPFLGAMIAFRSFEKGSQIVHTDKLLPADAMASFPSLYEMLPAGASLIDPGGAKQGVDLFDPAFWKKNRFGLLRRTSLAAGLLERRAAFTGEWLGKAHRLADLLQLGRDSSWQPPATLKVLNIVGTGSETLDSGYLTADGQVLFDPAELAAAKLKREPIFNNGDGTVTLTSAMVPAALESSTKLVRIEGAPHDTLFLDPTAEKEYKVFLQ